MLRCGLTNERKREPPMTSSREMVRYTAKRKGWAALGAGALTSAAVAAAISIQLPVVAVGCGVMGGMWTAKKVVEWLKYRGEWGLRF